MPSKKSASTTPRANKAKPPNKTQSGKSVKSTIDLILNTLYSQVMGGIDSQTSILLFHDLCVPMAKPGDFEDKTKEKSEYFVPTPTYRSSINGWLERVHDMCFKAITTNQDVEEVARVMGQVQAPNICPRLTNYTAHDDIIASMFNGSACTSEQKATIVRGYCYAFKWIVSLMFAYVMISGHKGLPPATTGYIKRMCAIGMFPQRLIDIAGEVVDEMTNSRVLRASAKKTKVGAKKGAQEDASELAGPIEAAAPLPEDEELITDEGEEDAHEGEDDGAVYDDE